MQQVRWKRPRHKRGTVVMQSRAGLLQPVRVDPKKQRAFGTAKVSRAGDRGQMGPARRMVEHQGIGDTGDSPPPPPPPPSPPRPHLRRGTPQDLAARRQMQKEMQEAHAFEPGMAGGMGRGRGGPPRAMMVSLDRLPPELARQLPQGPITLHYGHPPPHIQGPYFPPGSPKHFSSKSNEPPDKVRQGPGTPHPPRRGVGAMSHLASPVRVSSSPTGVSPRELPGGASPRELRLSSPRALANTPPATARGFGEDNASPRYSSDAEKTPRSAGGWKASPRLAEAPMGSPRGVSAQGDVGMAPEGRRGVPKDRGEERMLRNLNMKAVENKGGRVPERGRQSTNTAVPPSEMNKAPNDEAAGRGLPHGNPGGAAIYQMDRKGQFGRGGAVGPPQRNPQGVGQLPYGARPGQFPGPQNQQMSAQGRVPMSSPKINPTRTSADTTRIGAQKKPPTVLAKKSTVSPQKPPTAFSPAQLIASPATSPMNSPRPSLMATHAAAPKNTASRKVTNASKASPGSSPTRVPKSPGNSPARTYVVTPKDLPTTLAEPPRRTPVRSPQATLAANLSTKLQMDSSAPQITTSPTTGKDRKGKYQNPKTRLSAGGDLQAAKGRLKTGPHRAGVGETASPPGEKLSALPTQPSRESTEARDQPKEPSDLNKGHLPTKTSPLVRKLTKTSLLPVQNPSTPRSAVSQHLLEEEKGGNAMAKQNEGTPRKTNAGEGNKKLPLSAKNRKGAITGVAHTEGAREAARAKPATARQRRRKDSLDVASALPDTSGNYTSAVHQWLRQSHYKVISPQQYRQHETIQEETVKQTGLAEKAMAFKDERPQKAPPPEPEKPPPTAAPEKPTRRGRVPVVRCGDVPRSLSPLSTRYQPKGKAARPLRRAPLSLLMMKHKEALAIPKMAAASAAARAAKKASKAAAAVSSVESGKRKTAAKRGVPKGVAAKGRGPRRKKDRERPGKLPPSACPRLRPKVGPAGDSGDLSSSSEDSSFLSASDEAMNEQSAVC